MADPTPLPQAEQLSATAKLKQRDDAIRANGIKEGYAKRDAEWKAALGVSSMTEATEIFHLRAELKNRPTVAELGHAKHASRGFSLFIGSMIGLAAGVVIGSVSLTMFAPILNNVVHESTVTGAAIQQLNPPRPCTPGERLPDGRMCPVSPQSAP